MKMTKIIQIFISSDDECFENNNNDNDYENSTSYAIIDPGILQGMILRGAVCKQCKEGELEIIEDVEKSQSLGKL